MPGPGYNNMQQQQQQQQQVYDAPNCDYEPPKNFQQNFGNPYDCPEGFYNGSLMSSVGYSQVSMQSTTSLSSNIWLTKYSVSWLVLIRLEEKKLGLFKFIYLFIILSI